MMLVFYVRVWSPDGHEGPGYYYQHRAPNGEPLAAAVGPFNTQEAASAASWVDLTDEQWIDQLAQEGKPL